MPPVGVMTTACFADAWMGNAGADASNGNRHFRGQAIVKAVFSELQRCVHALAAWAWI
jgi:hypothetical protein